jgi:lipid A disaccharide synthetase
LFINKKHFSSDLEKAIDQVRVAFRAKHGIPENSHVIFFAPGNEAKEAEFSMDTVRKGVKEFLLKYSSPTSLSPKAPLMENYITVLSLHRGSEADAYVKNFLNEHQWTGRLVIVYNDENEHLSAMAASDVGIVYDGQMVGAAAANHLPTMILVKMRMHHQWFSDLYNQWWNNMNVIADNNIYPELIGGEAWFGKIADTLAQWYVKPETRFDMIRKWEYFLKDALSY